MKYFKMNRTDGTKPCPICGKTISANKELCLACFTAHGSLEAYAAKTSALTAVAEEPVAEKKPRKPRVKKEATADAAPKPTRKPRTKKTVEVAA